MSVPSVDSNLTKTESDNFTTDYGTLSADFFDDYLKCNSTTNIEHDYSALSDPDFSRRVRGSSGSTDTSTSSGDDDIKHQMRSGEVENEVWTEDLTIPHGGSIYSESSGRAVISESEILSLEDITLDLSHSSVPFKPLFSQSPYDTAAFSRKPSDITDLPSRSSRSASSCASRSLRNPIRKANSFPKMNRASQRSNSDLWATKLESSSHGLNLHDQASSMSCISSGFNTPEKFKSRFNDVPYINDMDQSFSPEFFNFETPLSTPVPGIQSVRRSRSELHISDNAIFPQGSNPGYISNGWSQMPTPPALYVDDTSLIFASGEDSSIWWNHGTAVPTAQSSPSSLHANLRQATGSLAVQLQNTLSHTVNTLPYRSSNMTSSNMIQTTEVSSAQPFTLESHLVQHYNSAQSPSQYLPHPKMKFCDISSTKPRLVRKPRFGPGEPDPPSPTLSPELQIRKRKTSRQNRQSTPRSPSLGAAASFVNYTPNDSQKILTGVAPSGSSKTKARREKEALEKRRKLSQAAVRAVRAVGGDVNALVEEGLFV